MENFSDVQIVEFVVSQIMIYTISIILESQVAAVRILEHLIDEKLKESLEILGRDNQGFIGRVLSKRLRCFSLEFTAHTSEETIRLFKV